MAEERPWTLDAFFAWQERQTDRYELVNGRPLRLSASSNVHDEIVVNLIGEVGARLRGSRCCAFTGNGAVETSPGQIRRPDVGVDCGRRDPDGYTASDPRVVFEVLSPTARDFNTIGKLGEYQSLSGLAHVVFVEPNEPLAFAWSRDEAKQWKQVRIAGLQGQIDLPALGFALDMRAIYDGVEFPAGPRLIAADPS